MSIDNKSTFVFFRYLLIFLLVVVGADLFLSQLPGSLHQPFAEHIPALVASVLILFLGLIRVNYFSYEDDYEIIQIHSRSLLFGSLSGPVRTRYDFPKRIVKSVRLKKGLFQKKLIIELQTQSGEKKINKFDLSFMAAPMRKRVYDSLKSIAQSNETLGDFNQNTI